MLLAHTAQFGDLEYSPDAVIQFPRGLPGFEHCHRFVFIEQPALAPVIHLQSLESLDICFLALPVRSIAPDYHLILPPEDAQTLQLPEASHITSATLCLALLSVAENGQATANLLAPIVMNVATRIAVQSVRSDAVYSHQHPLKEVAAC